MPVIGGVIDSGTPGAALPAQASHEGDALFTDGSDVAWQDVTQIALTYAGTSSSPITDASTVRPSAIGPVYWLCAEGVTPLNAIDGDFIWRDNAVDVNSVPDATATQKGVVELATSAEVLTGTDTVRAVTPAGIASRIGALVGSAPAGLDTLAEIAAAIGNDPLYSATVTNALNLKASKVYVDGAVSGVAGTGGPAVLNDRGTWAAATAYAVGDVVTSSSLRYACKATHTSSASFSTDLASKWVATSAAGGSVAGTSSDWTNGLTGAQARTLVQRMADAVTVKDFGTNVGAGGDDTAAFVAAMVPGNWVFVPPGAYNFNGTGIDRSFIFMFAYPGTVTINLGSTSYLFKCTNAQNELHISGIATEGGYGLYRNVSTSDNVRNRQFVIRDFRCNNFTKTAIGHNSTDFPNWRIQNFHLNAASRTGTIGIALNGLTDNCVIADGGMGFYQTGIKLGYGGNNAKIKNIDMTMGSGLTPGAASIARQITHIHVVPRPGYNNVGGGLDIEQIKFGNEWAPSDTIAYDKVIVYADDDTSTGSDFVDRLPDFVNASTGSIGGHRIHNCLLAGGGPGGRPFVYSMTPNVYSNAYDKVDVVGVFPSHVLQFAPVLLTSGQLAPDRNTGFNTASGWTFGNGDMPIGFKPCNVLGMLLWDDRAGIMQHSKDQISPFPGSGLAGKALAHYKGRSQAEYVTQGTSLAAVADPFGGTDARKVTWTSPGQGLVAPDIPQGNVETGGLPIWVEFWVKNDATSPMSDLRIQIWQDTLNHYLNITLPPASDGWVKMIYQFVLRKVSSAVQVGFTTGLSNSVGAVNIGLFRVYQSRTPVPLDIAHQGDLLGFYGAVPAVKKTVTGSKGSNAALTSLLTQLAALGLITDSTS